MRIDEREAARLIDSERAELVAVAALITCGSVDDVRDALRDGLRTACAEDATADRIRLFGAVAAAAERRARPAGPAQGPEPRVPGRPPLIVLHAETRAVLVLRYRIGLTCRETARALDIPESAVRCELLLGGSALLGQLTAQGQPSSSGEEPSPSQLSAGVSPLSSNVPMSESWNASRCSCRPSGSARCPERVCCTAR